MPKKSSNAYKLRIKEEIIERFQELILVIFMVFYRPVEIKRRKYYCRDYIEFYRLLIRNMMTRRQRTEIIMHRKGIHKEKSLRSRKQNSWKTIIKACDSRIHVTLLQQIADGTTKRRPRDAINSFV